MIKMVSLMQLHRGEFSKQEHLIQFDRLSSTAIRKENVTNNAQLSKRLIKTPGFYFEFYNWQKQPQQAALFVENDQLKLNFKRQEWIIKQVEVSKCLFWKKIFINSALVLEVYSPFYTLFMGTDMFPEDVEPIYGRFMRLQANKSIQDEIEFLKRRLHQP